MDVETNLDDSFVLFCLAKTLENDKVVSYIKAPREEQQRVWSDKQLSSRPLRHQQIVTLSSCSTSRQEFEVGYLFGCSHRSSSQLNRSSRIQVQPLAKYLNWSV